MKKLVLFTALFLFFINSSLQVSAQVSIGDSGDPPDGSAVLDLQSTDKGLLLPRLDYNDRPDPAPAGLLIFVTANGPNGDNALYYYNGTSWIKVAEAGISVGDQIAGGIVFYIDSTGNHGIVAAAEDQDYAPYGCMGTLIGPGAQFFDIGFGDQNTYEILNYCYDDPIAALVCDTLTAGGYNDWYLPSAYTLQEIYNHKDVLGNFSDNLYWSSTEQDADGAWIVFFGDGTIGYTDKDNSLSVRCVRKF